MRYSAKQYAIALYQAIFETDAKDQEKILTNFVSVLKQNGDLGCVNEIEQEFYGYEREAKGIKIAQVVSARELTLDEERNIIKKLNEFVGSKVELKKKVDEGLVGGVVIKIGDERIDGSVKGTLEHLKSKLVM